MSEWVDGRVVNDLSHGCRDHVDRRSHPVSATRVRAYSWLKMPVVDEMERVMAATTLPTLLLGGDPAGDLDARLRLVAPVRSALPGVRGLVVGRTPPVPEGRRRRVGGRHRSRPWCTGNLERLTRTATSPLRRRNTMTDTDPRRPALDRRRRAPGAVRPHRRRLRPRARRGDQAGRSRRPGRDRRGGRSRRRPRSRAGATLSITKRQQMMFAFRELLERAQGRARARSSRREHGKVVSDALGEITRGLEVVELATGFPHLIKGEYSENVSTGVDVYSTQGSRSGVVGIISPFNFPAMVPLWFFPIAIAAGNTVVLKPSEKDPSAANWLAAAVHRGRAARRRVHRAARRQGRGRRAARAPRREGDLVRRLDADRPVHLRDRRPQRQAGAGPRRREEPHARAAGCRPRPRRRRRDQRRLRLGGRAVHGDLACVVAVEPVADALVAKITERMSTLRVGDGRRGCDMGPLVTEAHRDKVASYIDIAVEDGADGRGRRPRHRGRRRRRTASGSARRSSTAVPTDSRVYTEEIFGPVLSIVRVVELRGGRRAHQRERVRQRHGDLHQRRRRRAPVPERGRGGHDRHQRADPRSRGVLLVRRLEGVAVRRREGLRVQGFDFFTREKAITSRWLDPSHGGINLGFPQNRRRGLDQVIAPNTDSPTNTTR